LGISGRGSHAHHADDDAGGEEATDEASAQRTEHIFSKKGRM
jgi:hypothetical protein